MYSPQTNLQPQKPISRVVKILLVDDRKFVLHKLEQMLSTEADLKIIGTASDGEMAIAQVAALEPDVVLIDIEMPKMNGIEATKVISQRFPDCKILILSSYEHREYVQKIIAAGADGYILKTTPAEDFIVAIHSVCRGYSHFGSRLLKKIQLVPSVEANAQTINSPTSSLNHSHSDNSLDLPRQRSLGQADGLLPSINKCTLPGRVTRIARDTNATDKVASLQQDSRSQAQSSAQFYEVSIAPINDTFGSGQHQCLLQLGMESQADIVSREETVLQFILRKARLTSNL